MFTLAVGLACAGVPSLPAAPENDVLHEVNIGEVKARWHGSAMDGMPAAYATERLTFVVEGEELQWTPTGTLNFSDWSFDIASPDGGWIVLLQDRHGPYHAVQTKNLKRYLQGAAPDQIVAYEGPPGFRPVFEKQSWTAPRTFHYVQASETPEKRTVALP